MSNYFRPERNSTASTLLDDLPAYAGPTAGFGESFGAAWNATVAGEGSQSLEYGFEKAERKMLDQIREMTGEEIMPIGVATGDFRPAYTTLAKHYGPWDGEDARPEDRAPLPEAYQQQVDRIEELRQIYPDIPNYRDAWYETQVTARMAERKQAQVGSRSGVAGFFGTLVGGAAGAVLSPETDPLNTFTLGLGGVGRTVLGRIASEGLVQMGIEGGNQLTGIQNDRRLLGLDYGMDRALQQIALTGVGGAALRGVAEGAGAGIRRLRSKPEPAPRVDPTKEAEAPRSSVTERADRIQQQEVEWVRANNPYGPEADGVRMFVTELEQNYQAMADWSRPLSSRIFSGYLDLPKADTAVGSTRAADVQPAQVLDPRLADQIDRVNERIADTEMQLQILESRAEPQTISEAADDIARSREVKADTRRMDAIDQRLADLERRREEIGTPRSTADRRKARRLERKIDEVRAQRNEPGNELPALRQEASRSRTALRKNLKQLKEQRRQLLGRQERLEKKARKLTGGEPSVRQNTLDFLNSLSGRPRDLDPDRTPADVVKQIVADSEEMAEARIEAAEAQRIEPVEAGQTRTEPVLDYIEVEGVRLDRNEEFFDFDNGDLDNPSMVTPDKVLKDFEELNALRDIATQCRL